MEFEEMPELKDVVDMLIKAFPEKLGHIKSHRMLYSTFSKKKSDTKGRIVSITPRYEIFLADACYILEIHKESWETTNEGKRLYVVLHELFHIPEGGFVEGDKQYKKLVKHSCEDFKELIREYGVDMESVDKLVEEVKKSENN
jgi:predicted metallopeptidase